ncbi:hypothetical protein F5Y16DRAFT_416000 [Xylariaceae sp. FL0255]|nr:hypothetical protein F5Y16DRAFT_416000 [Xylariaceae sp. FL0255]
MSNLLTPFMLLFAFDTGVNAVFGEGPFSAFLQPLPNTDASSGVPLDSLVYHDQHPNLTTSATFSPFENAWGQLGADSVVKGAEWTWRLNISQFYDAYNGSDIAGPSDRQAFVSQTYDFSWTTEGNLSAALDNASTPMCVYQLGPWVDLPVNVTNNLTNGTSCVPAFGQDCVDAMLKSVEPFSQAQGCFWSMTFDELPECAGAFKSVSPVSQSGQSVALVGEPGNTKSGDTFWVNMSGPVLGNETWLYETVANRIQLLLLSVELPIAVQQPNVSTVQGTELLCLRANNTQLPDDGVNSNGVATVGENVLEGIGKKVVAGVELLTSMAVLAAVVGFDLL